MYASVHGLEDASKYPNLVSLPREPSDPHSLGSDKVPQIVELLSRGWNDTEIYGVMGENLMTVMDKVDRVKEDLASELPSTAIWEKRTDLPADWGGPEQAYLPYEVREVVNKRVKHDEL